MRKGVIYDDTINNIITHIDIISSNYCVGGKYVRRRSYHYIWRCDSMLCIYSIAYEMAHQEKEKIGL